MDGPPFQAGCYLPCTVNPPLDPGQRPHALARLCPASQAAAPAASLAASRGTLHCVDRFRGIAGLGRSVPGWHVYACSTTWLMRATRPQAGSPEPNPCCFQRAGLPTPASRPRSASADFPTTKLLPKPVKISPQGRSPPFTSPVDPTWLCARAARPLLAVWRRGFCAAARRSTVAAFHHCLLRCPPQGFCTAPLLPAAALLA